MSLVYRCSSIIDTTNTWMVCKYQTKFTILQLQYYNYITRLVTVSSTWPRESDLTMTFGFRFCPVRVTGQSRHRDGRRPHRNAGPARTGGGRVARTGTSAEPTGRRGRRRRGHRRGRTAGRPFVVGPGQTALEPAAARHPHRLRV